jgi:hypothetical protein
MDSGFSNFPQSLHSNSLMVSLNRLRSSPWQSLAVHFSFPLLRPVQRYIPFVSEATSLIFYEHSVVFSNFIPLLLAHTLEVRDKNGDFVLWILVVSLISDPRGNYVRNEQVRKCTNSVKFWAHFLSLFDYFWTCRKDIFWINTSLFCVAFVRNIFLSDKYLATYCRDLAETHVGPHMKCPVLLCEFNQNRSLSKILIKSSIRPIKLKK